MTKEHVFILFCSQNDAKNCQDDKKLVMTSKIRHDNRQFVMK